MTCSIENCNRKVKCRGLCPSHYARWQNHGDNFSKTPILDFSTMLSKFNMKIGSPSVNGCIIWKGSKHETGYGKINDGKNYKLAHRVSYELFIGKIPKGMYVCHTCDVRNCVNPKHLFLGTHLDNMIDRDLKGRNKTKSGIDHKSAKLNDEIVIDIRRKLKEGYSIVSLAKLYNVSTFAISSVKFGRTWKHVCKEITNESR